MKKKLMVCLMVITLLGTLMAGFSVNAAAGDLVIDLTTVETKDNARMRINGFAAAGWANSEPLIQTGNYGDWVNLGKIDLTKYKSITISYGRDSSHATDPKGGFKLASGATQQENKDLITTGVNVYADITSAMKHTTSETPLSWKDFGESVTVNLDLTNYTAGTDVYLAVQILTCVEETCPSGATRPGGIGFAVDSIVFNAAAAPSQTETSKTETPETGDNSVLFVSTVAIFLAATVVFGFRKKETV